MNANKTVVEGFRKELKRFELLLRMPVEEKNGKDGRQKEYFCGSVRAI